MCAYQMDDKRSQFCVSIFIATNPLERMEIKK